MEKSRVLGLGLATIDQYVVLPAFPEPNQKYRSDEWYSSGGGNCANTLVALSRLGVQTELITLVGNDYEGRQILSGLEKENVSTKNVDSTAQRSSLSFVIIDKNKDTRTIINRPGPDYSTDISFNPSAIKGASMVYLDGRFQKSAKRLASLAVARDIPVTLDVERIGLFSEDLLHQAKYAMVSKSFHREYFGSHGYIDYIANLKRITEMGPRVAVTTLGSDGGIVREGSETFSYDAFPCNAVDTTGAGDAFTAGFIYGILKDVTLEKAASFGSLVAAKKCEKIGTREGLPRISEIAKEMKGLLFEK